LANKATATVHLPSSFKHQERARLGDYGGCRMAFRAAPSGVAQIGGTEYGGRVLRSGRGGRRFKSCPPTSSTNKALIALIFLPTLTI